MATPSELDEAALDDALKLARRNTDDRVLLSTSAQRALATMVLTLVPALRAARQRIAELEGERDALQRTVDGWAGIVAAHTYTPPQGATITTTSEPPSGKYGQTGRAFASAVCPVCDAHVWRDQFTGLFWTEGGLARHEHPAPAAREGERE